MVGSTSMVLVILTSVLGCRADPHHNGVAATKDPYLRLRYTDNKAHSSQYSATSHASIVNSETPHLLIRNYKTAELQIPLNMDEPCSLTGASTLKLIATLFGINPEKLKKLQQSQNKQELAEKKSPTSSASVKALPDEGKQITKSNILKLRPGVERANSREGEQWHLKDCNCTKQCEKVSGKKYEDKDGEDNDEDKEDIHNEGYEEDVEDDDDDDDEEDDDDDDDDDDESDDEDDEDGEDDESEESDSENVSGEDAEGCSEEDNNEVHAEEKEQRVTELPCKGESCDVVMKAESKIVDDDKCVGNECQVLEDTLASEDDGSGESEGGEDTVEDVSNEEDDLDILDSINDDNSLELDCEDGTENVTAAEKCDEEESVSEDSREDGNSGEKDDSIEDGKSAEDLESDVEKVSEESGEEFEWGLPRSLEAEEPQQEIDNVFPKSKESEESPEEIEKVFPKSEENSTTSVSLESTQAPEDPANYDDYIIDEHKKDCDCGKKTFDEDYDYGSPAKPKLLMPQKNKNNDSKNSRSLSAIIAKWAKFRKIVSGSASPTALQKWEAFKDQISAFKQQWGKEKAEQMTTETPKMSTATPIEDPSIENATTSTTTSTIPEAITTPPEARRSGAVPTKLKGQQAPLPLQSSSPVGLNNDLNTTSESPSSVTPLELKPKPRPLLFPPVTWAPINQTESPTNLWQWPSLTWPKPKSPSPKRRGFKIPTVPYPTIPPTQIQTLTPPAMPPKITLPSSPQFDSAKQSTGVPKEKNLPSVLPEKAVKPMQWQKKFVSPPKPSKGFEMPTIPPPKPIEFQPIPVPKMPLPPSPPSLGPSKRFEMPTHPSSEPVEFKPLPMPTMPPTALSPRLPKNIFLPAKDMAVFGNLPKPVVPHMPKQSPPKILRKVRSPGELPSQKDAQALPEIIKPAEIQRPADAPKLGDIAQPAVAPKLEDIAKPQVPFMRRGKEPFGDVGTRILEMFGHPPTMPSMSGFSR